MGSNLNMGRFFSKISKVSYIFTDPVQILYVAELIEFFKKINWLPIVVPGHYNEFGEKYFFYVCAIRPGSSSEIAPQSDMSLISVAYCRKFKVIYLLQCKFVISFDFTIDFNYIFKFVYFIWYLPNHINSEVHILSAGGIRDRLSSEEIY